MIRKHRTTAGAILVIAVCLAGSAGAVGFPGDAECMVALDNEFIEEHGHDRIVETREAVFHQQRILDLGAKTLFTLEVGDIVMTNGTRHRVIEIDQRELWTEFVFEHVEGRRGNHPSDDDDD